MCTAAQWRTYCLVRVLGVRKEHRAESARPSVDKRDLPRDLLAPVMLRLPPGLTSARSTVPHLRIKSLRSCQRTCGRIMSTQSSDIERREIATHSVRQVADKKLCPRVRRTRQAIERRLLLLRAELRVQLRPW